jgi:hypothetical protein
VYSPACAVAPQVWERGESCQNAPWALWAGASPSVGADSFDGYVWLRDGAAIAGQSAQSYTPTSTDVGHQLSRQITVTYPLPLFVTTSASSATITIQPPALSALRVSPGAAAVVHDRHQQLHPPQPDRPPEAHARHLHSDRDPNPRRPTGQQQRATFQTVR